MSWIHGEAHYCARLREPEVRAIIRRAAQGDPLSAIAADYPQVSKVTVHNIIQGKTWRHLGAREIAPPRRLGRFSTSDLLAELGHRGFTIAQPKGTGALRYTPVARLNRAVASASLCMGVLGALAILARAAWAALQ